MRYSCVRVCGVGRRLGERDVSEAEEDDTRDIVWGCTYRGGPSLWWRRPRAWPAACLRLTPGYPAPASLAPDWTEVSLITGLENGLHWNTMSSYEFSFLVFVVPEW